MDEKIKSLVKEYEAYAKTNGFSLNPNREFVEAVIKGLIMNEKKYGKRFCPCRPVMGNEEVDCKIVCPCAYHKDEIMKDGKCHCELFVR